MLKGSDTEPTLQEIGRVDFRTSRSGETATTAILSRLSLQYRYQPARLALARSLGLATQPNPVDNLDARPIRGETLFGQDAADAGLWISLVTHHAGRGTLSKKDLMELIAAHWARGAGLLWDGLRSADDPLATLAALVIAPRK